MFGKLASKAKELSSSDVEESESSNKINEVIQSQWPKIEAILLERLAATAGDKLNDEEFINTAFKNTYGFLPMPIRLVLSEDKFVSYCMQHKEPLLEKLNELNTVS
ncbi:hypothetical protein [Photobacterium minamisatsumaniensis]|uniref:hypothetical protein n=1 Tax=Photobacterium minamisatsumaniensis TaxID=2910233 RepID=UPI003D0FEA4A